MTDRAAEGQPASWRIDGPHDRWLGQLARAAAAGDRTARDALWEETGARLTRVARHTLWDMNREEQEDMAQEAFPLFLALVHEWAGSATEQRARRAADAPDEGFAAYLFGLFRWRVRNALRAARHAGAARVPLRETSASLAHADELALDLPAFLAVLPEQERQIFLLRVVDGRTMPEIAARLGLTDRSARRHWAQTRRRLRALLSQQPE